MLGKVVEVVIVRSEERLAVDADQVLRDGPGDRQAIVGARAAPDLIQHHQAPAGCIIEDVGGFVHLDHEGGLAARQLVVRADPGEDAIDYADGRAIRGYERADLGHQRDEGHLAEIGRLAAHVRACNDVHPALGVQPAVVRNIGPLHADLFDDRVPAADDFQSVLVVN